MTVEPIYVALGQRVLEERLKSGWTQEDLACQIGLARSSVANVELGRQRLLMHQVLALSDALDISPGELIGVAIGASNSGDEVTSGLRRENASLRRRVAELEGRLQRVARIAAGGAIEQNANS